jgi:hypothetical protein
MSGVYPERKGIKERKNDKAKQKINRVKQISIFAWRQTDIRRSGEKEMPATHDPQNILKIFQHRIITREQGDTTKTAGIIGWQNDGIIEGQQVLGDTSAAPALPRDIILARLELFCFSG